MPSLVPFLDPSGRREGPTVDEFASAAGDERLPTIITAARPLFVWRPAVPVGGTARSATPGRSAGRRTGPRGTRRTGRTAAVGRSPRTPGRWTDRQPGRRQRRCGRSAATGHGPDTTW